MINWQIILIILTFSVVILEASLWTYAIIIRPILERNKNIKQGTYVELSNYDLGKRTAILWTYKVGQIKEDIYKFFGWISEGDSPVRIINKARDELRKTGIFSEEEISEIIKKRFAKYVSDLQTEAKV